MKWITRERPKVDRIACPRLDLAPQCAGLLAISFGLSRMFADDHEQLRHGFLVYDALLAWLEQAPDETHLWNPQGGAPMAIA